MSSLFDSLSRGLSVLLAPVVRVVEEPGLLPRLLGRTRRAAGHEQQRAAAIPLRHRGTERPHRGTGRAADAVVREHRRRARCGRRCLRSLAQARAAGPARLTRRPGPRTRRSAADGLPRKPRPGRTPDGCAADPASSRPTSASAMHPSWRTAAWCATPTVSTAGTSTASPRL